MTAQLLDGKKIATQIRAHIKKEIESLKKRKPTLAVILVGDDPASQIYVKNKRMACDEVGMVSQLYLLDACISQSELIQLIHDLNDDPMMDGILVQLPLPPHINNADVIEALDPKKDVDGFHPYNLGRLAQFNPTFRPCTPYGIIELLHAYAIEIKGKHAVVVGASNIVGKPMALELLMGNATITLCHNATQNLKQHVKSADILISAVGKKGIINSEWISPHTIVIDVGINRINNKITGDFDFETAVHRADWITPVPGGVGPMTVAMLLQNTLLAYRNR